MKRLLSWFERKKHTTDSGKIELPSVLVGSFSPLNRLEELLIEAGYEVSARPAFEQEFLDYEVCIAIRDDGQPEGQHENSGALAIYTLAADDNQTYPVGLTALDRGYECFGPETVMAKMPGRHLLEMVVDTGLWVNPSSAVGVLWKSDDLKRILSR